MMGLIIIQRIRCKMARMEAGRLIRRFNSVKAVMGTRTKVTMLKTMKSDQIPDYFRDSAGRNY